MQPLLMKLADSIRWTGSVREDVRTFLTAHQCPHTLSHSLNVADEARRLATLCGTDEQAAETAGLLHDISACIPNSGRLEAARAFGLDVLPEEERFPPILHQQLSRVIAQELFGVGDESVLGAIACHTTLKAGAVRSDHVLFVADKIKWDQAGTPPYLQELQAGLDKSVEHASLVYLTHLWDHRHSLKVLHPWAEAAYHELSVKLAPGSR